MFFQFLGGGRGNCLAQDETNLLHIMDDKYDIDDEEHSVSKVNLIKKYDLAYRPPIQCDHDYADIPNFTRASYEFSEFKEAVVGYIAGFVGKSLGKRILCYLCHTALGSTHGPSISTFVTLKDRGSLFKPSKSVVKVCEETEIRFQRMLQSTTEKLPTGDYIYLLSIPKTIYLWNYGIKKVWQIGPIYPMYKGGGVIQKQNLLVLKKIALMTPHIFY